MSYDVIVIGSGLGGLATAALLAKQGKKVIVLEQAEQYGGYAQSMEKQGYVFDYAIHSVTDWRIVKQLLDEIEETLPLGIVSARRGDRIVFPDHDFLATNVENIINQLTKYCPEEKENIERYFKDLVESMTMLLEHNSQPTLSTASQLVVKYPHFWTKSLEEVIDIYFKSATLKALIYGFHDGYCYDYSWYYSGHHQFYIKYLSEAHAIRNGSRHLVDALVRAITKFQGELRNKTLVRKILLNDGMARSVVLDNGEVIEARDAVISNADARLTYLRMLDQESLPPQLANKLKQWDAKGESLSYYLVNVGLDIDVRKEYGMNYDLTVYYPSYDLPRVFKDMNSGKLPDDFWLWAVFPSVNDSTMAPPGHSTAVLSTMVPYNINNQTDCASEYFDGFSAVAEKGIGYETKKLEIERKLIARTEEVFPGISKHIVFKETWTPQTFQDFTLNYRGSTMGFKVGSVPDRGRQSISKSGVDIRSSIPGLYQVGAWAEFGFSTIAVIQSARFAVYDILGVKRPPSAVAKAEDRVVHLNTKVKEYE